VPPDPAAPPLACGSLFPQPLAMAATNAIAAKHGAIFTPR
jgi:hypothetical protein